MTSGSTATKSGALSGYRILDMSAVIMGPLATQILADNGAEVIMIEPVKGGLNRAMDLAAIHQGLPGNALNLLRNKRSMAVDMKDAAVRTAILEIARSCDVVVSNLLPKSLAGLGLAYEDFAAVKPDIIMCNAQGFRSDGPRINDPAYDDTIQAECGLADATLRMTDDPGLAATLIADKVCGLTVVNAVLTALLHRERTGRGQKVEVPMLDVMRAFTLVEHGGGAIRDFDAPAGYNRVLTSGRGPQRTRDGVLNMMPYCTANFDDLFEAGGLTELVGSERSSSFGNIVDNMRYLNDQVRAIAPQRTNAEWQAFCAEKRIPVGTVPSLEEVVADMPVEVHPVIGPYRHIPPPVVFSDSPASLRSHAQLVGQDTRAILAEAGLSPAEIDAIVARGAAHAGSAR